jgi:hypothetical protein
MKSKKTTPSTPARKPSKTPAKPRPTVTAKVPARKTPAAKAKKSPPPVETVKPAKKTTAKPAARKQPAVKVPPILLEGDVPPAPPVHGPGQRYALGPSAPPVHFADGEPGELPAAYGTKRLIIAARDPHWIYAHWDFTADQQREYNRKSADGHLVLRVFVDKAAGAPHTEVHVHPESRNWFVHVGKGGKRYVAQIGYFDKVGRWTKISESAATLTPPDSLADDTTARFATLPTEVPFQQLLEVVKAAAREHLPLAQAIQEIAHEQLESLQATAGPAAARQPHLAGLPTAPDSEWTPAQERALAELISMDTVRRVWIGSLEVTELVRRRMARDLSSMAAAPVAPGAVPGSLGSLSSPFGAAGGAARKGFWFNINAELIIYGATEPDATVTIGGRAIQLRKDGTFSYRFALPDGNYELPVMAMAADQSDARAADLKFQRRTEYRGEVGAHPQDAALRPPRPENT